MSLTVHWGYRTNVERQCYAYSTCNSNRNGVYKDPETGKYYAFIDGARTALAGFVTPADCVGKPLVYETNGPKDMCFSETQADYLIRKGKQFTAKYFAKKYKTVPSYDDLGAMERDAHKHFLSIDKNFDKLILSNVFKNSQEAEKYLLDTYRNKRFDIKTLTAKGKTAWDMLPQEVQNRFLRWA